MKKLVVLFASMMLFTACQGQSNTAENVDAAMAREMLAENQVKVLDVRTPEEYQDGHIEGATQINFYEDNFEEQLKELPKDESYLVYCHSGNRSGKTLAKMKQMGFEKVYNLKGGISAWKESGNEVKK